MKDFLTSVLLTHTAAGTTAGAGRRAELSAEWMVTNVRETVQKLSGAGQVAPLSELRINCLAFHSIEAPSPLSFSAEDHAPKLVLSKTTVDALVEVVAGKD